MPSLNHESEVKVTANEEETEIPYATWCGRNGHGSRRNRTFGKNQSGRRMVAIITDIGRCLPIRNGARNAVRSHQSEQPPFVTR